MLSAQVLSTDACSKTRREQGLFNTMKEFGLDHVLLVRGCFTAHRPPLMVS